jgi:hypothetical protein
MHRLFTGAVTALVIEVAAAARRPRPRNSASRSKSVRAVRNIAIPVMLLQPANDSLEPSRVLGAEFVKLKKPYVGKVYPATGPDEEQRHCFGGRQRDARVGGRRGRVPRPVSAPVT